MGLLDTLFAAGAGATQAAEGWIQKEEEFKKKVSIAEYNHQKALELEAVRNQNNVALESIRTGNEIGKLGIQKGMDEAADIRQSEREEDEWSTRQDRLETDKISAEERAEQRRKDEQKASSAKEMIKIKTDYLVSDAQQKINEKWAEEMASAAPASEGLLGSPAEGAMQKGGTTTLPRDKFGNTSPPQIRSAADAMAWAKKYGLEDYARSIEAWLSATTSSKESLNLDGVNEIYRSLFPEEKKDTVRDLSKYDK
jgi:hypothetical protein